MGMKMDNAEGMMAQLPWVLVKVHGQAIQNCSEDNSFMTEKLLTTLSRAAMTENIHYISRRDLFTSLISSCILSSLHNFVELTVQPP